MNEEALKQCIHQKLEDWRSTLEEVKAYVVGSQGKSLGTIDKAFIERIYVEHCAKLWIQDSSDELKQLISDGYLSIVASICTRLSLLENVENVPYPLNISIYYSRLMDNRALIHKHTEENMLKEISTLCLECISDAGESASKSLIFLDVLTDILSEERNPKHLINKLNLDGFCQQKVPLDDVLKGIVQKGSGFNCDQMAALQEAARNLLKDSDSPLSNKLKALIESYLKPTEVQESTLDGRLVLEAVGRNVAVGEDLQRIEQALVKNPAIEEVRFVATDALHIDASLPKEVWHGKNIVVATKLVKVCGSVVWDVSGKDDTHRYERNAGTDETGRGKDGQDGYPGESGGNVLMMAKEMQEPHILSVRSNGGRGSQGQDGGNGTNGEDGKGITWAEFEKSFPTIISINNKPGTDAGQIRSIQNNFTVMNQSRNLLDLDNRKEPISSEDWFIEAISDKGNSITLSFTAARTFSAGQVYFLYAGAPGENGRTGGMAGCGGQGGYAGDIRSSALVGNEDFSIRKYAASGTDGENGKGGVSGVQGKEGWGVGYLDYAFWRDTKFYGKDQQSKCSLQYYDKDNSPSTRVWCYRKNKYVGISAVKIENKKQNKYEERNCAERSGDRQCHARARRKNAILQHKIREKYSHHLELGQKQKQELHDLKTQLDKTRHAAMQALVDNRKQEKTCTLVLNIRRTVTKAKQKYDRGTNVELFNNGSNSLQNADSIRFITLVEQNSTSRDVWLKLQNVYLDYDQLGNACNQLDVSAAMHDWIDVEETLRKKYAFATLREISKQIPPNSKPLVSLKLIPFEKVSKFLYEKPLEQNGGAYHDELGTLNQYLYQDDSRKRGRVLQYSMKLYDENSTVFRISMQAYFGEVMGNIAEQQSTTREHYSVYQKFMENKERIIKIYYDAFEKELSRPRHKEVYLLWIESMRDGSAKTQAENRIEEDDFLRKLYSRYKQQSEQDFNWDSLRNDRSFVEQYQTYVCAKGFESECYRLLLAHLYDVCVRFYTEDLNEELVLQDAYNSTANQFIHVLFKNAKLIELTLDEDFASLEYNRLKTAKRCSRILHQVLAIQSKEKMDAYLTEKLFEQENDAHHEFKSSSSDEEQAIQQISSLFEENIRGEVAKRLAKLRSEYIGRNQFLHVLAMYFSVEKRHLSHEDLYFIIHCILASVVEDRDELDLYCWIAATCPQSEWFQQCLLMEIENKFKKQLTNKQEILKYLNIINKNILRLLYKKMDYLNGFSLSDMNNLLHLLSDTPKVTADLTELELAEWSYALKENYWAFKVAQLVEGQDTDSTTAVYYVLSLENRYGSSLTEALLSALSNKKRELTGDIVIDVLLKFHQEAWILSEALIGLIPKSKISDWIKQMETTFHANNTERDIVKLVDLIKSQDCVSEGLSLKLESIRTTILKIRKNECIIQYKPINVIEEGDIERWVLSLRSGKQVQGTETDGELLAVIDRAIELKRKFRLRDAQKLAILTLLRNEEQGTLAQVSTGEGKSLIVVALAIMKSLKGEKVHIVTSSAVLAKRDAVDNSDIYSLFGVTVAHNCNEDIEKRKEAYSSASVVYGDLLSFQRDYLLDRFYQKNILGDHDFRNVIVDEVDSMLLDKGNNMLYLSHDLPDFGKLDTVYLFIWQWMSKPVENRQEVLDTFNVEKIKIAILDDIYGAIRKEDLKQIDAKLTLDKQNKIWEVLLELGYVDKSGKLLQTGVDTAKLTQKLNSDLSAYGDRIIFMLNEQITRDKRITIPNYLKPFVERHLEAWINSAKCAFFMKPGQHYVIDVDRSGTSPDRNPNITIIDRDTGTDQANSQWDEALHQFLQLKHGCKLSLQSLKAVFISNVSYLKLYPHLYGLTGTLGSQVDRDLLNKLYNVEFVIIPTAKPKLFRELQPLLCVDRNWVGTIVNNAMVMIREKKRSVLVICETVNDVELIEKAFEKCPGQTVHTYTRDYEKFVITQDGNQLQPGQIIIATNLAGRGTDIKISEDLKKAGGLHVILTYLPANIRVEQQAFGRAARCGDAGSGQLILDSTERSGFSTSKVFAMKTERDKDEFRRISSIKAHYETQIVAEESCFDKFRRHYERLERKLKYAETSPSVVEILMQSCLDKWTYWLDKNAALVTNGSKEELDASLKTFLSELNKLSEKDLKVWVQGNPTQMIKLGKFYAIDASYTNAVEMFDELIAMEPEFCEAARYYKAFALSKQIGRTSFQTATTAKKREIKHELRQAERLYAERSRSCMFSAGCVGHLKQNNSENIVQIAAYEEQQRNMADCYYMFSRSIDDAFGHIVSPETFLNHDIDAKLAQFLCEDLQSEGILSKPKVRKRLPRDKLELLGAAYAVAVDAIEKFLSNYKGKIIDEKDFVTKMKQGILFASREKFWKKLTSLNVLVQEEKYVVVSRDKLTELQISLPNALADKEEEKITSDGDNWVFLYNELLQQQTKDCIFKKNLFKEAVGKETYELWKKLGVTTSNRRASFVTRQAESVKLDCFNSLSLKDFTLAGISRSDAEQILIALEETKIITKNHDTYDLNIHFDKMGDLKLDRCPIYETPVKRLLSICFAYRIALQKMIASTKSGESSVRIELMPKPHRKFAQDLLQQGVVKPTKVAATDVKSRLDKMYQFPKTKNHLKRVLERCKLVSSDQIDGLFDYLIEKKWIREHDTKDLLQYAGNSLHGIFFSSQMLADIKEFAVQGFSTVYTINNAENRQKGFKKQFVSIEHALDQVLNHLLVLSKENVRKFICETLDQSRSALKKLEKPDGSLKPLIEQCGQENFANANEVQIFFLNGLNLLLQFEKKRWTLKMVTNSFITIGIGLTSITVGTVIELCSVGFMTPVGAAFVNEGVNDIFYAASSLRTGYFSWKEYRQQKLESIIFSALTAGFAAGFSKGAKSSRFGNELFGPGVELSTGKATEVAGSKLVNVGEGKIRNTVIKAAAKRVGLKGIESVALAAAHAGVDQLVQNYLRGMSVEIGSFILGAIGQTVENHDVVISIEQAYKLLGEDSARKMIQSLITLKFSDKNWNEKWTPLAHKILGSITRGIAEGIQKAGATSGKIASITHWLGKGMVWTERITQVGNVAFITKGILDNLRDEINIKLDEYRKKNISEINENYSRDSFEQFKKDLIAQWKSLLNQKAGQTIECHIVSPLLKEGASILVKYVGKTIQTHYSRHKESINRQKFDDYKYQYEEDLKNLENQGDNGSEKKNEITEKYHAQLIKLMTHTRSIKLFSDIVNENIPMDLTCANACVNVVHQILIANGIDVSNVTIEVVTKDGIKQSFSSGKEGDGGITIPIELINNHFQLTNTDAPANNDGPDMKNNCLFDAVKQRVPELKNVSPDEFRNSISKHIEQCPYTQLRIVKGWHRLPVRLGAVGGAPRRRTARIGDCESTAIPVHLVYRLELIFQLCGFIQHVSERKGLERKDVIETGESRFLDKSCSIKGKDASHIVRAKGIHPEVGNFDEYKKGGSSVFYNVLVNILGHTQNVDIPGNRSVGRKVDNFQTKLFNELASIDFSRSFTAEDSDKIGRLRDAFIGILVETERKAAPDREQYKADLRQTIKLVSNIEPIDLFSLGQKGYAFKGLDKFTRGLNN